MIAPYVRLVRLVFIAASLLTLAANLPDLRRSFERLAGERAERASAPAASPR